MVCRGYTWDEERNMTLSDRFLFVCAGGAASCQVRKKNQVNVVVNVFWKNRQKQVTKDVRCSCAVDWTDHVIVQSRDGSNHEWPDRLGDFQ